MYFITAIHFESGLSGPHVSRCVGYLSDFEEARSAVLENRSDIYEFRYEYAVIEDMNQGVYPVCLKEWWFYWDDGKETYLPCDKPQSLAGIVNFAIG